MTMREYLRVAHLTLGLTVGALFVVTGLTGSALVFYPELDALLNAPVRSIRGAAPPDSYQAVYEALRRARPDRPERWRIEAPERGGAVLGRSESAADRAGTQFAPVMAWVDPRDNRVVRSATWGETAFLMTWIYDLHYRLHLGKPGAFVMGIVGLFLLGLLVTGLLAWWPRAHTPWRSWRVLRGGLRRAQLYETHTVVGIVAAPVLLVITVTGVMMSIPEYVRPLVSLFPTSEAHPVPASVQTGHPRISLDAAIHSARARFPEAQLRWIETPDGPNGAFRITLYQAGEPSYRFPQTYVWVDQYSAHVIALRDPRDARAGDMVLDWRHGLHNGEAFGLAGRVVAAVSGLVPLFLFFAGTWYWFLRPRGRGSLWPGP
jgi:uncharacterized iron-regulated membrane protein